jgi:dUTP pyrophosphatase
MEIAIQLLDDGLPVPGAAHPGDAGVDLSAREAVKLEAGERATIPTGIAAAIPGGHAGLVVPRSGLAARHGISVVNGPGLIDSGYRGEIQVVLINLGKDSFTIERGDRIAQLVVIPVSEPEFIVVQELPESGRGSGGFGSTGA